MSVPQWYYVEDKFLWVTSTDNSLIILYMYLKVRYDLCIIHIFQPSRPNDRAQHGSRAEAILNQPSASSNYHESLRVQSPYKPSQVHNTSYQDLPLSHGGSIYPSAIPSGQLNQGYSDKSRSKVSTPSVDPEDWSPRRGHDNLGFSQDTSSPVREARGLNREE